MPRSGFTPDLRNPSAGAFCPRMLSAKSVQSPKSKGDGLRILAARFRGRGFPSTEYDVWMPNLAPSEALLRGFQRGEITWAEFTRRYTAQMSEDAPVDLENRTIKNHGQKFTLRLLQRLSRSEDVTVLCHCAEEEMHCHRHVLRKLIERV
jgi:uncharacterized protein YeaO (DUF488 family)